MKILPLLALLLIVSISVPPAFGQAPKPESDTAKGKKATPPQKVWLTDIAKGRSDAVRNRKPILVRVGAEWCPWCRKLDQEIAVPEVQTALGEWTLVALDADKSTTEIQALGVGSIPALRILSPLGRVVSSHDGFLNAKELVAWLEENREKAADVPVDELSDTKVPTELVVVRLIRQLDQQDALLREIAIHRLQNHPTLAAEPVVAAFAEGTLQRRLAAMELLSLWRAPVTGIDPWQPKTVSADRLKTLRDWATEAAKSPASQELKSSPDRLAAARVEIDRLVAAKPTDVPAARERLARLGRDLLPTVYERLKKAELDDEKERLTALRYRLAASEGLVLRWPGGLERLAASAVATRHQAVDELTQLATADDEGLWLELFSDPDPLVREIALKGLNSLGNSGGSQALIGLLADPEPNVRAAVLKQLAEHPSARQVARLKEYLAKETDPDLVVHAVRVLREIQDPKALPILIEVLKHDKWSVRAEAVEGIGKQVEARAFLNQNDPKVKEARAQGIAALIGRLDDPDGFVIGRAVTALKDVDSVDAVEPLLKVVEKHPELAAKAIESIANSHRDKPEMKKKAMPLLRNFAKHPKADIRAATVTALGESKDADLAPEVLAGLSDSESRVRMSAANVIMDKLDDLKREVESQPTDGETKPSQPGAESPAEERLTRIQEGESNPTWIASTIEPLTKMLAAPSADERMAAALPLVASGRGTNAVANLLKVAKERPDLITKISAALPWLHWADRADMFRALLAMHPGADELGLMASHLTETNDPRSTELLWNLIDTADSIESDHAHYIYRGFETSYFGRNYYNVSEIPQKELRQIEAKIRPRAASGSELQRVIALSLLLKAAPEDAGDLAQKIMEDPKARPEFRRDAFQIRLLAVEQAEGRKLALAALTTADPMCQTLALKYLASDFESVSHLRSWLQLSTDNPMLPGRYGASAKNGISIPRLPRALTTEMVSPLLTAKDPETVAMASYVLALQGDPEGLKPLLDFAFKQTSKGGAWDRRIFQAISRAGDDSHISSVERVYNKVYAEASRFGTDQIIKDLYWTIRGMDGPNARRLRQKIRREVGMPFLRGESGMLPTQS